MSYNAQKSKEKVESMKYCCICGKEAKNHAKGLWWCEKHIDYAQGEYNEPKKHPSENRKIGRAKLGLAWV